MLKTCFIFGALAARKLILSPSEGDYVIAADKGVETARAFGISPDEIIGDFDSLGYIPSGEKVTRLAVRKDDTDVGFALKRGLELGFRRFVVFGAVGGALDHTCANIQLAAYAENHGAHALFIGEQSFTAVKNCKITFDETSTGRISVFSLEPVSSGVCLSGLDYEIQNAELKSGFPLGVSNAFVGKNSRISVRSGTLLAVFDGKNVPNEFLKSDNRQNL